MRARPIPFWRLPGLVVPVLLFAGCASPPGSYVLLVPDADGSTGRVAVTDARGTRLLDRPMQAAALDGAVSGTFDASAAQLSRDFGAALAAQPPLPETLVVHFERGGVRMTADSAQALDAFADRIRRRPVPEITIVGHTDTLGEAGFNERLGLARAREVAAALRAQGVEPLTLSVASDGERTPAVETADDVDEPRNRRVVVTAR
jgi:outer membrane protein OmpA-like peptidoglycan-associated protein